MSNAYEGTYDDPENPQPTMTREDRYLDVTGYTHPGEDFEVARWLLVQVHVRTGERYFETFRTAPAALGYGGALCEIVEGWDPCEVWDLDTGTRYEIRQVAEPIFTLMEWR